MTTGGDLAHARRRAATIMGDRFCCFSGDGRTGSGNDPSCDRIQPAVGVGKRAGMTITRVSAKVSRKRRLVARAISASTQKQLLSRGSARIIRRRMTEASIGSAFDLAAADEL
jgi:hypothetical protein